MPILTVEIVGPVDAQLQHGLTRRLADAAGAALQSRAQGTWVKTVFISPDNYAENAGGPPPGVYPVLVSVLLAQPPHGEALQLMVHTLTSAIAEVVGRAPDNVHIVFEPAAAGRIAFGGNLQ